MRKHIIIKDVPESILHKTEGALTSSIDGYVLSSLAVLHNGDCNDTWVTTAMVPDTQFYLPTGLELPALATAHWTDSPEQLRSDDDNEEAMHQRLKLCKKWLGKLRGGRKLCSELYTESELKIPGSERDDRPDESIPMHALYDCVAASGTDHFVSKNETCSGADNLRILGYVTDQPTSKLPFTSAPLFLCFDSRMHDHKVSTDEHCTDCGGTMQELLGYGFLLPT